MKISSCLLCHHQPVFKGSISLPLPIGVKATKDISILCFLMAWGQSQPPLLTCGAWICSPFLMRIFSTTILFLGHHSPGWKLKHHHFIATTWKGWSALWSRCNEWSQQFSSVLTNCCEEDPGEHRVVRHGFCFIWNRWSGRGPRSPLLCCSK